MDIIRHTATGNHRLHQVAAALFVVIFALGCYGVSLDVAGVHWWADIAWTMAALLAAWRCFTVAVTLRGPEVKAWCLFAAGNFAWFLGMLYWDYQELVLGQLTPFPAISDIGFLSFAPLFAAGLIFYRNEAPSASFTIMEVSQIGIFIACIVAVHIVTFYGPLSRDDLSVLYRVSALAYPALYMALLVQMISSLWIHAGEIMRWPLILIALAVAVDSVTNSFYAYSLLGHSYEVGNYLDVAWVIGFALIYCAAEERLYIHRGSAASLIARKGLPHPPHLGELIPSAALLVTLAVLMAFRDKMQPGMIALLEPVAFLLVAFLALREWASARRESEEARRTSEQSFRRVFDAMPAMASISRLSDGRFLSVNDTFLAVTGLMREEVMGRTSDELNLWVVPFDRSAALRRLQSSGRIEGMDWRIRVKSGEIREVLGSFDVLKLGDEECLLVIGQDVTERRQAEMRMKKLSSALEQTADAVMIANREGVIEYVNHAFSATSGYTAEEVVGKRPNILKSGKQGAEFYHGLWMTILAGEVYNDVFINRKKDGSLYYEEKTITPLKDGDGAITHFVSTGHDISERMQTQERLQFLAHHDVLTGLPNRSLFLDRLKQALAHARWHNRVVGVLFFDADRFKNINDTLGHDVGDQLLQAIAQRLLGCLRERDTVARFGGDEFVMVLSDVASSADVGQVAKKIIGAMQPPFVVNNVTLHVTASIGISLFPADGEEAGGLLSSADAAMYLAKDSGRNYYQFYSKELGARAFERLSMENSLRQALDDDQFVLHYQPQIDVRDGRIVGVEALLRWQHPDMGLVSPLEFIPLLEETGLIIPVGEWVLRAACAQLAQWRKDGWDYLRMAVNLSGIQFNSPGLLQVIADTLVAHQLNGDCLELEITESVLMSRDGSAAAILMSLDKMGVRLGLDDFGTGYSSLSYLRRFPIHTLKIDRSFVRDIPDDAEDSAITHAIIVMGKTLKLELIAEGVETKIQADYLLSLGCHIMQGFLFSRPLPAVKLTRLLALPAVSRVS